MMMVEQRHTQISTATVVLLIGASACVVCVIHQLSLLTIRRFASDSQKTFSLLPGAARTLLHKNFAPSKKMGIKRLPNKMLRFLEYIFV